MKGEGWCKEAPEDAAEGSSHCIHPDGSGDLVCCWCGDLFVRDDDFHENAPHGEYLVEVTQPGYTPVSAGPHDAPSRSTAPLKVPGS